MKSVLVTGGTRRIGKAIADRLRADGWRVITSSHRRDANADLVRDLSRGTEEADGLYEDAEALAGGKLDAIVNNAALFSGEEETMFRLNADAPRRLMERIAFHGGSVVNILDSDILRSGEPADSAYLRSKRRLLDDTRRFAASAKTGLRVNAVAPGPVLAPEDVHVKAGRMIADRPSPEDIAAAVAFLLETKSVTGVVIPVDAGQHLLPLQQSIP